MITLRAVHTERFLRSRRDETVTNVQTNAAGALGPSDGHAREANGVFGSACTLKCLGKRLLVFMVIRHGAA
jgi:hypothetical protein